MTSPRLDGTSKSILNKMYKLHKNGNQYLYKLPVDKGITNRYNNPCQEETTSETKERYKRNANGRSYARGQKTGWLFNP